MPTPTSLIPQVARTFTSEPSPSTPRTSGLRIAIAAEQRVSGYASDYSVRSAPRSPNTLLTSNRVANSSRLAWLADRSKCNQFVGDVLSDAGMLMPMYRMPDGSSHYVNAEALIKFPRHFQTLAFPSQIQKGDLIVIDNRAAEGENGAHVEVVSEVSSALGTLEMIGAHRDGAYAKDYSRMYRALRKGDLNGFSSITNSAIRVFALRPQLTVSSNLQQARVH